MFERKEKSGKTRIQRIKDKVRYNAYCALNWVERNPQLALMLIPAGVAVFKGTTKVCSKMMQRANMEAAQREIRRRCYDPSEGHYWFLKRELSNDEWLLVNNRHQSGERLGDILNDLRVLK